MRILYVTTEFPFPPKNGVRIVSYQSMKLMRERGHVLALATLSVNEPGDHESHVDSFLNELDISFFLKQQKTWVLTKVRFVRLFLMNKPTYVEKYDDSQFRGKLQKLIGEFKPDAIHLDLLPMYQYFKDVNPEINCILSINDSYALTLKDAMRNGSFSWWELPFRFYQYIQAYLIEKYKYRLLDAVHVVSKRDYEYLKRINPSTNVLLIPNGVDSNLLDVLPSNGDRGQRHNVLFVGKLDEFNLMYLDNFIRKCWGDVTACYSDAKLIIVGEIVEASRELVSMHQGVNGVSFDGFVQDISTVYEKSDVVIVPVNKTCGIINKALEAMSAGLAVVGFKNSFVGIDGVSADHTHIEVDKMEEMGSAIVDLFDDHLFTEKLGSNARAAMQANYSWVTRSSLFEGMYGFRLFDK